MRMFYNRKIGFTSLAKPRDPFAFVFNRTEQLVMYLLDSAGQVRLTEWACYDSAKQCSSAKAILVGETSNRRSIHTGTVYITVYRHFPDRIYILVLRGFSENKTKSLNKSSICFRCAV